MPDAEPKETLASNATATLDSAFLALLCCPVCKERPHLKPADGGLHCGKCGRTFPIRDGLPDLRPESGIVGLRGDSSTNSDAVS